MLVKIDNICYEIMDYYRKGDFIYFKDKYDLDKIKISLKDIEMIKDIKEHCLWDFKEITDSPSGLNYKWDIMESRKNRHWTKKIKDIEIIKTDNKLIIDFIGGKK